MECECSAKYCTLGETLFGQRLFPEESTRGPGLAMFAKLRQSFSVKLNRNKHDQDEPSLDELTLVIEAEESEDEDSFEWKEDISIAITPRSAPMHVADGFEEPSPLITPKIVFEGFSDFSKREINLSRTPRGKHKRVRTLILEPRDLQEKGVAFEPLLTYFDEIDQPQFMNIEKPGILKISRHVRAIVDKHLEIIRRREAAAQRRFEKMAEAIVVKMNHHGILEERIIYLSEDFTELKWKKNSKLSRAHSIDVAAIDQIIIGPRTTGFFNYDWSVRHPWLCFSIITQEHLLEIECLNSDDFMTWFVGVHELMPLSYMNPSLGKIRWDRCLFKTIQIALKNEMAVTSVWNHLAYLATDDDDDNSEMVIL